MDQMQSEPGVSGKDQRGGAWVNCGELQKQKNYLEVLKEVDGDNLLRIQVLEALFSAPEVDLQGIRLRVIDDIVYLEGTTDDINNIRLLENVSESVSGVKKVISQITPKSGHDEGIRTDA